jgi:acyl-CoA thioesterase
VSGGAPLASAFDRATAVEPAGTAAGGVWSATVDESWSAPVGPNGGYIAAIVLRAMEAELADEARSARSLTLHYLRPPAAGPLDVEVTVQRSGRRMSTLTARATQGGRLHVLAIAAFGGGVEGPIDFRPRPPAVAPADELTPSPAAPQVPISAHFDMRPAIGAAPFSGAAEALSGGWLRLHEPRPLDAPVLALYADAWWPPVFARMTELNPVPTVDLTIHFRDPGAAAALDPAEPVLAVFRSGASSDGFVEEDGELWSRDGVLLAQSRQLAVFLT